MNERITDEAVETIASILGHPQWCQVVADGRACNCTATDKAEEIIAALKWVGDESTRKR